MIPENESKHQKNRKGVGSMHRFDPRIYLFTVGHFAIDWAQGALPALLPYFIATCQMNYQDAGTLIFANLVFSSILQPVLGYYADRVARPWFAPLGIVLSGASIAVLPFVTDYWALFFCSMISGFGSALYHPEGARMVNGLAGAHKGKALGTFSVGGNGGFAAGPMFAGFCAYVADIHGLLFYAVFNIAVALLLLHRMPAIQRDIAAQSRAAEAKGQVAAAKNDWASFGKLTVLIFARSIGFDVCNAFLPLYLISVLGATAATGSLALTILFGLGAVITYFGGILADRLGYVRILRIAFLVMAPAMFLLVNSGSLNLVLLFLPLVAFALFAPYSSAVVLGQTYLGKNIGFASGVTLGLTTTFGGLVTPLIGRAADQVGIGEALQVLWIVAIIGAVCSFALRTPEALKQPETAREGA